MNYISYNCSENELTSLKYSPKRISGVFICQLNKITSLKEGPTKVNMDFFASFNNIEILDFIPEVGDRFRIRYNKLYDIQKIPDVNIFEFNNNPIQGVLELLQGNEPFEYHTNDLDMIIDYGVIDHKNLYLFRLNSLLLDLDKPELTEEQINDLKKEGYLIIQ